LLKIVTAAVVFRDPVFLAEHIAAVAFETSYANVLLTRPTLFKVLLLHCTNFLCFF
jgi:hypothetical protein